MAAVVDVDVVAEEKEDDEQHLVNVSVKEEDCSLILGLRMKIPWPLRSFDG